MLETETFMSGEQTPDLIQVAVQPNTGFARVSGRGSFKVSSSIKEFSNSILADGRSTLVLDLEDCIGMDSTFMGVLAGVCVRFRKEADGKVVLVNVSPKIERLISTLGLDRLVEVHPVGTMPEVYARSLGGGGFNELPVEGETPLESAETMLEAHENLVDVFEGNRARFQDVLDYLREDIRRQRPG